MSTEETKFYCISGLIKAAESFARDKESHEALTQELKKNHIPETNNLVTEESFHSIMSERCAPACLPKLIAVIVAKYDELGYAEADPNPENCANCGSCMLGWL